MDFGIMEMFRHKTYTLKSRITHSIFIAFFTFFCAHKIFSNKKYVVWYLLLLIAGVINLFFVVNGRTGQLVFIALVPLFAIQRFSKKGLLVSVVVLAVFLALYINFSDKSTRVYKGLADIQAYLKIPFAKTPTNGEIRYVFWEHSMQLVTERPWFGHGTGSFAKEYQRITANKVDTVGNPHNEFLLIAVQLGFLGLFIYAGFLFSQYYYSRTLPDSEKWLAQGLLLTLIVTSLFNSPFLDHTEGHWFATLIALCFAPTQTDNKIWTGYA
jgi:O-antigen ligase